LVIASTPCPEAWLVLPTYNEAENIEALVEAAVGGLAILFEVLSCETLESGSGYQVTGKLTDVTDATFKADVLDADGPVLVDFWAPWCGPCRVVHPVLEEIDGERDDLKIVSINVDENQQTAAQYEVLSIPTLILFRDGAIAKKVVGAMPKRRLEAELEPALA
jgi:thioredoxin 1